MTDQDQSSRGDLAAFGRHLVRERELRGLSLADVARATKLPASAIEAIEAGDAARTPHRAYVIVYLRGYAAAVGLDADDVVLRYEEAVGPPVEPHPERPRRVLWVVAVGVAAVVAAALAWWWSRRG